MNGFVNQLLTLALTYGYPVAGGAAFISSCGVPLPMSAILLLLGSLAAAGTLNFGLLFVIVVAGSVAGDSLDFYLGRRLGPSAFDLLARLPFVSSAETKKAQAVLARWAGLGVFLARWLLTPIGSVISVVAGVSGFRWRPFLIADVAGELLGAGIWLGAGYIFGSNWQEVLAYLGGIPGQVTVAVAALLLIALAVRRFLNNRQGAARSKSRISEAQHEQP